jgi:hypothetical protein
VWLRPFLRRSLRGRYFSGFVAPPFVARGMLSAAAGAKKSSLRPAAYLVTLLIFYHRISLSVLDGGGIASFDCSSLLRFVARVSRRLGEVTLVRSRLCIARLS